MVERADGCDNECIALNTVLRIGTGMTGLGLCCVTSHSILVFELPSGTKANWRDVFLCA